MWVGLRVLGMAKPEGCDKSALSAGSGSIDLMHPLLAQLTFETVQRGFDGATLNRAHGYVDSVAELEVGTDDGGALVASAYVRGTHLYECIFFAEPSGIGLRVGGDCGCPVGLDCKHAAAIALVLLAQKAAGDGRDSTPRWARELERLVGELDDSAPTGAARKRLALQIDLKRHTSRYGGPPWRMSLRPLQQGARDNWIKTGASWFDIAYLGARSTHDEEQSGALARLGASIAGHHYYGSPLPQLTDCDATIWPLLQATADSGVTILPGGRLEDVELHTAPVDLRVNASTDVDGGVRVDFGIDLDGDFVSGDDLLLVGKRAHGVVVLRPSPSRRDKVIARLIPLRRSLPEALTVRLRHGATLVVPHDDRDDLATTYLPRLARHLPVGSTDGSVELKEPAPPRLSLLVAWHGHDRADLTWQWRYAAVDGDHVYDLDSADGLRAVRRPEAEQEQLAALDLDDFGRSLLTDEGGALRVRRSVTGYEVVLFAGAVLTELRERVEVHEVGEQVDYRETADSPTVRFDAEPSDSSDKGPTDWLDLEVVIEVAGERVPLTALLAALTLSEPYVVLPSGLYLATDRPEFARLADLVEAAGDLHERGPDEQLRVSRGDLGTWAALDELGVVDAQAAQWVAAARRLQAMDALPEVDPTGVTSTLRDYQLTGFRWLAYLWETGLGGILADDMGLGKTLQTLALVAHARERGSAPFLVIAPTSVVQAWQREAAAHTPHLVVRGVSSSLARRPDKLAELADGADILVTSYTLFRLEADDYQALEWGGLVLDEAQAIKNHQGKTYQQVRRLEAPFRLAITGTPFENRLMELWSLLSVAAPGLYPQPRRFTELVVKPVEKEGDEKSLERFRRRIRPFLLRRTKELVAKDLPPKQEQVLDVELSPKHRRVYDTHLQRERQSVLGLVNDFNRNRVAIFAAITRLRQLSLDPGLVDKEYDGVGSAKIDVLVEHLVELAAEGHRALVFSQFTTYLARVKRRLDAEGIAWAYLDGRTRDRAKAISDFTDGDAPAFLISLKAGGVGLTLTEADYVFVLDPWWNPAVEAQAVDRTHRIGQTRSVNVYRLVATDTIEQKVMELKARKAALFDQVLDGDVATATGLSADDIRGLFDD